MATAPKAAPIGYEDPEAGRSKVLDPSRSRASSSGTAGEEPLPSTVGPTSLFGPGGIYSGLTRKRVGSRRRHKKKTKKAGRRKSRR
jgi:hypothetical protein